MKVKSTHVTKTGSTELAPFTIPEGGFLTFPKQVTIKHFEDAATACTLLAALQDGTGKACFDLDDLAGALGIRGSSALMNQISYSPEQEDLVNTLSIAIELEPNKETREDLWDMLAAAAKYELLLPGVDSLNISLYELLQIETQTIRKAFVQKNKVIVPVYRSASIQYGMYDEVVAGQLGLLLRAMPKEDVPGLVKGFSDKHLYLLMMSEIEYYVQNDDDNRIAIMCAMKEDDVVPEQCPMLNAIQELAPLSFMRLQNSFLNGEFPELREAFHDTHGNPYGNNFYEFYNPNAREGDGMENLIDDIDNAMKNAD